MPNGAYMDHSSSSLDSRTVTTDEGFQTVGRMVDWCLTLELNDEDEEIIDRGFATMQGGEQSLNQSLSWIHKFPIFLDIEIKKSQSNRAPEVQLAIWAASALRKRQHHGWDISIAMPAIAVDGHMWTYWIFFASEGDLVCSIAALPSSCKTYVRTNSTFFCRS